MKKTLLEYLLSSLEGLPDSSEKSNPVLKIQPIKGVVRFLPKDFLGCCDVYHSAVRWPQPFEEERPKEGDGCLILAHLIPQDNGALGILINKGKRPSTGAMKGSKSAFLEYNRIDVMKIGSVIAEELAAGAHKMDQLISNADQDGYKMSVHIANASTIQQLDFPKPESVKT